MKKVMLFIPLVSSLSLAGSLHFKALSDGSHNSQAYGISGDGSKILGYAWGGPESYSYFPCYWDENGACNFIVDIGNSYAGGAAYSSNYDGSVIVGNMGFPGLQLRSFRFENSTLTCLPDLIENKDSRGSAVSETGEITGVTGGDLIYPMELYPGNASFSWTEQGGIRDISQYLTFANLTFPSSKPLSITADGTLIAGCFLSGPFGIETSTIAGYYKDGQWNKLDPSFGEGSVAYVVTPDGKYFGGKSNGFAFRKEANSAPEILFPGFITALSDDGRIGVGGDNDGNAVIWTQSRGVLNLNTILRNSCADELPNDFQGAQIATGISADGSTIVGYTFRSWEIDNVTYTLKRAFLLTGFENIESTCASDFNSDSAVDDTDFTSFIVAYNDMLCPESQSCPCDINFDDLVDDTDFTFFVVAYNKLECE